MSELKACPNCNNVGWYVVENVNTGEPEQEQCRFCYTEPNSVFNVVNALNEQIRLLKEVGNKLNELIVIDDGDQQKASEAWEALMKQLEVKK
jgi:hypothetical protein